MSYKIAISGKANSGKNTLAEIIKQCISGTFLNLSFAKPIKKIAKQMFPHIPNEYLFGSSSLRSSIIDNALKDNNPLTIRQLLIDIGENAKIYNKNIWVDHFNKIYNEYCKENLYKTIVVTDLRFTNEYVNLKNLDFFKIRLKRDDYTKINHSSETEQDQIWDSEFDVIIYNNGSLEDLTNEFRQIQHLIKP